MASFSDWLFLRNYKTAAETEIWHFSRFKFQGKEQKLFFLFELSRIIHVLGGTPPCFSQPPHLAGDAKNMRPWPFLPGLFLKFVFAASNLKWLGNITFKDKEKVWLLLAIKWWLPQDQGSSAVLQTHCYTVSIWVHTTQPP